MFVCPLDQLITRSCGAGGVWGQFDETACGSSVSGQLNGLVDLFSNVRYTPIKTIKLILILVYIVDH